MRKSKNLPFPSLDTIGTGDMFSLRKWIPYKQRMLNLWLNVELREFLKLSSTLEFAQFVFGVLTEFLFFSNVYFFDFMRNRILPTFYRLSWQKFASSKICNFPCPQNKLRTLGFCKITTTSIS